MKKINGVVYAQKGVTKDIAKEYTQAMNDFYSVWRDELKESKWRIVLELHFQEDSNDCIIIDEEKRYIRIDVSKSMNGHFGNNKLVYAKYQYVEAINQKNENIISRIKSSLNCFSR